MTKQRIDIVPVIDSGIAVGWAIFGGTVCVGIFDTKDEARDAARSIFFRQEVR